LKTCKKNCQKGECSSSKRWADIYDILDVFEKNGNKNKITGLQYLVAFSRYTLYIELY